MISWYYRMWVGLITKMWEKPENKTTWKFYSISFVAIAQMFNLICLLIFLGRFTDMTFYNIKFDIFPGQKIDALLSGLILFIIPSLLFNYLLIFRNDRYKILIEKYTPQSGKLFLYYFFISILLFFIPLIVWKWVI
jgi:hypothetical protein